MTIRHISHVIYTLGAEIIEMAQGGRLVSGKRVPSVQDIEGVRRNEVAVFGMEEGRRGMDSTRVLRDGGAGEEGDRG